MTIWLRDATPEGPRPPLDVGGLARALLASPARATGASHVQLKTIDP